MASKVNGSFSILCTFCRLAARGVSARLLFNNFFLNYIEFGEKRDFETKLIITSLASSKIIQCMHKFSLAKSQEISTFDW